MEVVGKASRLEPAGFQRSCKNPVGILKQSLETHRCGQRNSSKVLENKGVTMYIGGRETALITVLFPQPNLGCWVQPQMVAVSVNPCLSTSLGQRMRER